VVGKVGLNVGVSIEKASVVNGRMQLELKEDSGAKKTLAADHVISATGYRPDVQKLEFLDNEMLSGLRCVENTPRLSSNFESSVPNLYFVGITAANTFGPLLRFAFGARFAAPRLSKHLARSAPRNGMQRVPVPHAPASSTRETAESVAR
jgi:thioredoxin reductase